MSIYHVISTFILALIGIGLWKRRDMKIHVPAMLAAFGLDVMLVLIIEINRQAIETVAASVKTPDAHALLLFHVSVSLATVILYAVLTYLGFKVLKGNRGLLKLHRNLAAVFLLCRLANYVTSFYVIQPKPW
ncbi:MAG: hypothetical protein VKJ04_07405 [Vampirovibrionales bacterium]|nr:hypothetical protein [Vampirovibrionales bacterium]